MATRKRADQSAAKKGDACTRAFSLAGETALITGGGTGLGLAIAECMNAAGARVVLVGRRETELSKAVFGLGADARFIIHDITQVAQASDLLLKAEETTGNRISILVNNAGIHLKRFALQTTAEDFRSVLGTHVLAGHALTRAVLPGMLRAKHGSILFISSMAALFGVPQVSAYAAAKAALLGLVRTLASEVSRDGIRINAIVPGWINTEMTRNAMAGDPARKRRVLARTPMRQFGQPEDVGWAAVYLCSRAAQFVTGTALVVDGGASIGF